MIIGVNTRVFNYQSGGTRVYTKNILSHLLETDKDNRYVIFYGRDDDIGTFPSATEISLGSCSRISFDWIRLPTAIRKHKIDVAFFPTSTMTWMIPCKAVVTMHDLGYFYPEMKIYPPMESIYMRSLIRYSGKRADHIISVSESTRKDIINFLGVDGGKVSTVHEAADELFSNPVSERDVDDFRKRQGLAKPYFLYTVHMSPRKNMERLIEAFAMVRKNHDVELVVTGPRGWSCDFEGIVSRHGQADHVRKIGFVPDRDMPCLYRGALVYVFPSFFEGFGLPILEAQASGCPVICSNRTSLPGVAGNGALIFDASDTHALADAMISLVHSEDLRKDLITRGHENEKKFSWKKASEQTLNIFNKVMDT